MSAPILRLAASQRPVFLINSRLSLFTAASRKRSTPFPYVPRSFCRVPYRELSRSPSHTLRAFLCRFMVRAPVISLEVFLDSVKSEASVLNFPPHHSSRLLNGFAYSTLLLLGRTRPAVRSSYPPASPHRSNDNEV